jgi:hypothetical protein
MLAIVLNKRTAIVVYLQFLTKLLVWYLKFGRVVAEVQE